MRANDAIFVVCCYFSVLCTRASANANRCPGGWSICPRFAVVGKLIARDIEIRRYDAGLYLERYAPSDSYGFTCSYAYFDLINYFNGDNLHQQRIPKSSPLIVSIGRQKLKGMRKGRFYLGKPHDRRVAPPFSPSHLMEVGMTTYYVRTIDRTLDFNIILKNIEEMVSDLLEMDRPIDTTMAHVVHYEYPQGGDYVGPNEILIAKLTDELEMYVDPFR